ncbi:exonuclease V-like isoform X2 [Acanthaster planci]|uniref:Exonuclease V-like isoform X2 n=1 Tax=Acanthaster planci TaxID=133434 RepID=A0A8B7YLF1_ACAPL|nr:exonuclease V-like isoform X2 [Acanthaster planci]
MMGRRRVILEQYNYTRFSSALDALEMMDEAGPMNVKDASDSQESISESQNRALHHAYEANEQSATRMSNVKFSDHNIGSENLTCGPSCNACSAGTGSTSASCTTKTEDSESSLNAFSGVETDRKQKLRLGNTYLTVSNLVAQLWCEQQMVYNFWKPDLELIVESTSTMPAEHKAAVKAVVAAASSGSRVHEKRDHEVNKYIPVKVKTREDNYGIRLVNIMVSLRGLLLRGEPCAREIPIFGLPLGHGFVVVGTIDELRFDSQGRFELVEFKTRGDISRPIRRQQMQAYKMQMMMYKKMLEDLGRGHVDGQAVLHGLKMDPHQILNDELLKYVRQLGDASRTSVTLGELMSEVMQQFEFLPYVDVLTLEFSSRDDSATITTETVDFDADWLQQRLDHCHAFWAEERDAEGVDIEDTWKCGICAFYDRCEWRQRMNEICAQKNIARRLQGK